ncbi:MAG: hypothetical protein QM760_13280 [Nibricoccus sp.]
MAVLLVWLWLIGGVRAQTGFDAGTGAVEILRVLEVKPELQLEPGTWLRIRDLAHADGEMSAREWEALRTLRKKGVRICALVEWPESVWREGVRAGGGRRVALDLREVWERARQLGREYAGSVDAWEIGNEPDISFLEENPETYAAYLKTCRLGLLAGAKNGDKKKAMPRVLMAPLGLPPGPYFERLWANGAGGATDGFNFHFYGHAEDFSDVYGQFRDAVEKNGDREENAAKRDLPVFLTEYGYGLLDGEAGRTREGRARQERWFQDVRKQLGALKPEGAMAFMLMPYIEQGRSEFGLLIDRRSSAVGGGAPSLDISPALSGLLAIKNGDDTKSKNWRTRQPADNSPVVLDFVARDGLEQRKSFLGYFVRGISSEGNPAGWGDVVIYNFSNEKVVGLLTLGEGLTDDGARRCLLQLEPGERRSVRVRAEVNAAVFEGTKSGALFSYENKKTRNVSTTRLVTTLWPDPTAMTAEPISSFSHDERATDAVTKRLLNRWTAKEEPVLRRQGRWLVSQGVSVTERSADKWAFTVDGFPTEPSRPAMAELPLPEEFVFEPGMLLEFVHRLSEVGAETEAWFDVYFRAENGNLYQVWPRVQAGREWRGFAEAQENFTMAFYGRAKLPWRFAENRPVALVFFFRPEKLPAIFEIEDAAITRRVVE